MDKEYINVFKGRSGRLLSPLIIIFSIFLIFLTVWFGVSIENKIKEGRYIGQEIASKNIIAVSGKAEIYANPDLALITASVVSDGKTVNEAMKRNTKKMNSVINFVKKKGVSVKDVKTVNFSIYPRYEWNKGGVCLSLPCPTGKRVLVGYEVNQSLEVKIRNLEEVGDIVQGMTSAGANEVSGLRFTIDDKDKLEEQAREEAIKKAKAQARKIASQLGVRLLRIIDFNERSVIPRYYNSEKQVGIEEGKTLQIEKGENKIESNVTITYEIN